VLAEKKEISDFQAMSADDLSAKIEEKKAEMKKAEEHRQATEGFNRATGDLTHKKGVKSRMDELLTDARNKEAAAIKDLCEAQQRYDAAKHDQDRIHRQS